MKLLESSTGRVKSGGAWLLSIIISYDDTKKEKQELLTKGVEVL